MKAQQQSTATAAQGSPQIRDTRSEPRPEQHHGAAIFPNTFEDEDDLHLLFHEAQPEEDPGSDLAFQEDFFGLTAF